MDKATLNQFIAEIDDLTNRLAATIDDKATYTAPERDAYRSLRDARWNLRRALHRLDPVEVQEPTDWNPRWSVTTTPVGRLDGHDIQAQVQALVAQTPLGLPAVYDSESGQFWAYTDTEATARHLAALVERVVRPEYDRV